MNAIVLLLTITPLMHIIVYHGFYTANVTTPILFLTLISTLVSLLALYYYFFSKKYRTAMIERLRAVRKQPLFVFISLWLLAQIFSLFSAYNTSFAWWGHPVRWGGVITSIVVFTLCLQLFLFLKEKQWQRLFVVAACVTGVLFIGEIVALLTINERPTTFAGNPIFLCQLFLFGYLALYFSLKNVSPSTKKIVLWCDGSILFVAILFTQSRAVLLALLASGLATGLLWLVRMIKTRGPVDRKKIWKRIATIGAALVLLLVTLHVTTGGKVWSHIPGVSRIVASTKGDSSLLARFEVYKTSLQIMNPKEISTGRFLFGWGNDNFQFAWIEHYNPSFYISERALFDRSHNILLDALVMNGVVGLLVFLGLLISLLRAIFTLRKESFTDFLFLFFIFTTYLLQAMTAPDGVGAEYYIYLFVAYLLHRTISVYEKKS